MNTIILILLFLHSIFANEFNFFVKENDIGEGRIFALAAFNLSSEYCLLDSGARITVVEDNLLFSDLEIVGKGQGSGLSGNTISWDIVQAKRIILGSFTFFNQKIARMYKAPWDCVIGNDLLKLQALDYDFDNKKIGLSNKSISFEKKFPLHNLNDLWSGVDVYFNQTKEVAIWDTGATLTLIDKTMLTEFPDNFEFIGEKTIEDAKGTPIKSELFKIKKLIIADKQLTDTYVFVTDMSYLTKTIPGVRMILGYNVISKFNWRMDYQNKSWSANFRNSKK